MIKNINISFGSKTIIETLRDEKEIICHQHNVCGYKHVADNIDELMYNIEKNPELSQIKIAKRIGSGASAIVYEIEDGDVLKLTKGSHYPLFRPHEEFDVPIKKEGKAGKIHYYIEEKLYQHSLHEGFVQDIKNRITNKGYKVYDLGNFDINQIGFSKEGKLYLLDPECAKYKTIFHAIWSKLKRI